MKIILFRFEKEKINFIECDINGGNLIIGNKESICLDSTGNRGEKYNKIIDELLQIQTKYSADLFAYQSPQKFRGIIKDAEGFANSAIIHLFCYQNSISLLELTPVTVREKLSISSKEFKILLKEEEKNTCEKYNIARSDKILDGLVFLSLLKNIF